MYAEKLPGTTYTFSDNQFTTEDDHYINLATTKGCDSTILLRLKVIAVFIPNAFSPNGDATNDHFEVYTSGDEFTSIEMSIFDRWAGLLYKSEKWNGTYKGSYVNPGVYVYYVKIVDVSGEEAVYTSSFSVLR